MTLEPAGGPTPGPVIRPWQSVAVDALQRAAAARVWSWRAIWELLHDLSVAVLFCFFLITFVAQAFRVQGTSMEPLLRDGDRILVNKIVYRFSPIERGDVVVFWYPRDPSVSFIKRVVGRPGDRVEIRAGQLHVNGIEVERGLPPTGLPGPRSPPGDRGAAAGTTSSSGTTAAAATTRGAGAQVPEKYIYGRAALRFWPLNQMGPIR